MLYSCIVIFDEADYVGGWPKERLSMHHMSTSGLTFHSTTSLNTTIMDAVYMETFVLHRLYLTYKNQNVVLKIIQNWVDKFIRWCKYG